MFKKCGAVIVTLLFIVHHFSNAAPYLPIQYDQFLIEYVKETQNCLVNYLKSFTGERYILKQKNRSGFNALARSVIREAFGTYIANECNIPGQKVWIIPAQEFFIGKVREQLSTLHLVVPGIMVKDIRELKHLDIRQRRIKVDSRGYGIEEHIIKNMAYHPDLVAIVALDSLIGNCGRHNENFFYDKKTDKFYFIDMDGAFKTDHLFHSCNNIEKMIANTRIKFTKKELNALKLYAQKVKQIYNLLSGKQIIEKLDSFLDQAQINEISRNYIKTGITETMQQSLKYFQKFSLLLVALIEEKSYDAL